MAKTFKHPDGEWRVNNKGKLDVRVPETVTVLKKADVEARVANLIDRINGYTAEIDDLKSRRMMLRQKRDDLQLLINDAADDPVEFPGGGI